MALGTMKKSRLLRTAVLAMALCGWGLAARADLVYDVAGTFGTTTYTGPLNGGTFSGTFDATLPANSSESITTYSIALISASGLTLADLTGAGGAGSVGPESASNCGGVSCDVFLFPNGATFLELTTSAGFAGGAVNPFNLSLPPVNSFAGFDGDTASTDSIVTSGSITSVPEPSTWAMLLLGFAGIGFMAYRRKSNPALMAA
jgi:hypothetical protein